MISERDVEEMFYKIYKREITINEFENWTYENESIEQILGDEAYLQLLSLNYRNKDVLSLIGKILFPFTDAKEIKKIAILNIMGDLITEYLDKKFDRDGIVRRLIYSITFDDIDEFDDEFLNDCYYAIYGMNEDRFETYDAELVYLKECFDDKRTFSRKDRDEYINKNAQEHYKCSANIEFVKKELTIDGNIFDNVEGFYSEVDKVFTRNSRWKTGHNLDAFNDILRGGFGVHKFGEPIALIWKNSDKSRKDLSWDATVKHYEEILDKCHPINRKRVKELLKNVKSRKGDTLFDIIIGIIKGHEQIELILK